MAGRCRLTVRSVTPGHAEGVSPGIHNPDWVDEARPERYREARGYGFQARRDAAPRNDDAQCLWLFANAAFCSGEASVWCFAFQSS
jgi:hypothetical protein